MSSFTEKTLFLQIMWYNIKCKPTDGICFWKGTVINMKTKELLRSLRNAFAFSIRDALITLFILGICSVLCVLLQRIDEGSGFAAMLYILAVFMISLNTTGYLFGTLASFLGVLIVNFAFTFPYMTFNFTLAGYPLTILCTLAVSITTSTLITKIKKNSDIRIFAEKEKTRSNLLRAVSHDLRTPLTTILGSTSAIIENDDVLDKKQRLALLSEIKEDAEWLIRMVENLLTVTRIEEGNEARLSKTPEICEEIVYDAVRKFRKRFPDIEVRASVPDEFIMVPMDAMLIEQVLINLLENIAIHARGASYAAVNVEYTPDGALFEVSDDGCGIPEDELSSIFDIYREKKSDNEYDSKKNMGIGLSVCRTIVDAHNGTMSVKNRSEGGAVFAFVLPINNDFAANQ